MLSQMDIDNIAYKLQNGEQVFLYYVAHMIETREGFLDSEIYKSASRFKVVKIEVTGIVNAYFEKLNFINHPEEYHVELEEEWYGIRHKYLHMYNAKNITELDKNFTPTMPSIIYGRRKIMYKDDIVIKDIQDPSPVKEVYTNDLQYGELRGTEITEQYDAGNLDWKYMTLDHTAIVDGIEYKYVTSDWYILDIKNFPRTEKVLVNADRISAYFTDLSKAFYFLKQMIA